jgi:hypothetical protein
MDATTSKKPRKSRKGYYERHPGGVLTRRPHGGSRNTKPRAIHIKSGDKSHALMKGHLDARTTLGRAYKKGLLELKSHLSGELSIPQAKLCDQATRLGILSDLCWAELTKPEGVFQDGVPPPAFDAFLRAAKAQRDVLQMLGIQRRAKKVTLSDYLHDAKHTSLPGNDVEKSH